ncbi:MAG: site-specific DNA-methyltransferase [Candidatus Omnitrophota bacterium]
MSNKKQKLELTWIGKDEQINLEPRILIKDSEKSYGDKSTDNMLIYGDNLLALKALEQGFSNKIKCVYIDPPYNTGSAFEHYDDNLEHSLWLNLMKPRLEVIHKLLKDDGILWISIDDEECHYLKVLCDEIFGRKNFITSIAVKMSTASGVKTSHRDKTIIKEKEYILVYAKNKDRIKLNPQYVQQLDWDSEFQYMLEKNDSKDPEKWEIKKLRDVLKAKGIPEDPKDKRFEQFVISNSDKIWRRAFIRSKYKELSQKNPDKIFHVNENDIEHYYYRGREMYFYKNKFHECFSEEGTINSPSHLLGDFWIDINTGKLFNEGGVDFRNGKKPEFLIGRILALCTESNDFVLDSFLGSGSTGAVAQKMGRRWIGIELGEHCHSHSIPRLKAVIDGNDLGGISKAVDWKGGGGFKYYYLAPSLLKKDKYDNWIIDEKYNADMLAAAMAKHEGFKYCPNEEIYWKQGQSTEKDFIFTTTQFVTVELLDKINEEMKDGESLLICAKSFQKVCGDKYSQITVKKIPQMLLGRCEFGKEDYNLNIIDLPEEGEEDE